ncbi:cytochrome b5 [Lichtheimia hyalospora FSU 10163]|nr:cytochrome b5 [Lichtheimia hyalospora FSU 10163]
MTKDKIYTYEQVAKHNTRNDLWMVIHNKVFDITPFIDEHPGGAEVLFDEGAKDASGPFDDVGHSDDARELMTKYYIGNIDSKSAPVIPSESRTTVPKGQDQQAKLSLLF